MSTSIVTLAKSNIVPSTYSIYGIAGINGVNSAVYAISNGITSVIMKQLADVGIKTTDYEQYGITTQEGAETVAEAISKIERGLSDIKFTDKIEKTAEELNAFWKSNGYVNPPYKLDIPAYQIKLTEETSFVKVYDGVNSNEYGQFVMKLEDITNADGSFLTAQQIKDKYALEFLPKYVADAKIPACITMNCGIAGPIEGWGSGGGLQFDLNWQKVGNFTYRATLDK